jgi:hypothetical protein
MPAYLFDEFIRDGILKKDGIDESGVTIFRVTGKRRKRGPGAA